MGDVIELFRGGAHRFDFFQAVRLLEELGHGMGGTAETGRRIRFNASPATVFPAADIAEIRQEEGVARVLVSFMGLVGAVSPLPPYVSHEALRGENGGRTLRAFLDLFNGRLYELFYESWRTRMFHPGDTREPRRSPGGRILESLTGTGAASIAALPPDARVACAGVIAGCPRSAEGLRVLLETALHGTPVCVRQRVGRWSTVQRPARVGGKARLGDDAVIGTKYWDTDSLAVIEIGPMSYAEHARLQPGTPGRRDIESIIAWYVGRPVEWRIDVLLAAAEFRTARLGDTATVLGRNAVLGQIAMGP